MKNVSLRTLIASNACRRPRAWSYRTKLLLGYFLLVTIVEGVTLILLGRALEGDLRQELDRRLEEQTREAVSWVEAGGRHPARLAARMAAIMNAQVTLLDAAGRVVGDSRSPAGSNPNKLESSPAPELRTARAQGVGKALRPDAQGHRRTWVARSLPQGGYVRLSVSVADIERIVHRSRKPLWIAGLIALLAAGALGAVLARMVARPLRQLTHAAAEIAQGRYHVPIDVRSEDEFGTLAVTMRNLAKEVQLKLDELTTERDQLRRLESLRERFVADVSHELRTPIAAIQGYSETLLQSCGDAATRHEFVHTIHRQAQRIARLVDDLLHLSDLDLQQPGSLASEEIAVRPLLENVCTTLKGLAEERRADLRIACEASVHVFADRDGLERIVENLMSNALRYGAEGEPIDLRATEQAGKVRIEVEDRGHGIAAEELPRITERFYRIDRGRSRQLGGTGLGLAIVHGLAHAMGGRLEVQSRVGKGSRFAVVLPCRPSFQARERSSTSRRL